MLYQKKARKIAVMATGLASQDCQGLALRMRLGVDSLLSVLTVCQALSRRNPHRACGYEGVQSELVSSARLNIMGTRGEQ